MIRLTIILIASLTLFVACEDNDFKATGGEGVIKKEPVNPDDSAGGKDNPGDNLKDRDEENLNGIDDGDDCLATGVKDVNIVIVLDNSGSQESNDPGNVRASASKEFARKLAEAVDDGKLPTISMSVVGFNKAANPSAWVRIRDSASISDIENDISNATQNPGGGTKYAPAFSAASTLFSTLGTDGAKKEDRNYVIFLTDGEPKDDSSAISSAVDNLISSYDTAIIAVASGSDVDADGAQTVQNLARPSSNDDKPKHVGQFIRAVSSDDLKSAWESIFNKISKCS